MMTRSTGANGAAAAGALDSSAAFAALPGVGGVYAADAAHFTVLAASDALLGVAQRPREAIGIEEAVRVERRLRPGIACATRPRAGRQPAPRRGVEAMREPQASGAGPHTPASRRRSARIAHLFVARHFPGRAAAGEAPAAPATGRAHDVVTGWKAR